MYRDLLEYSGDAPIYIWNCFSLFASFTLDAAQIPLNHCLDSCFTTRQDVILLLDL